MLHFVRRKKVLLADLSAEDPFPSPIVSVFLKNIAVLLFGNFTGFSNTEIALCYRPLPHGDQKA